MVAKITFPKKIEAALNYNETKVRQGKAVCLGANNFLKEAHEMNFYQKLEAFRNLNALNQRALTNTIHVSLNFDPSERLTDKKLTEIAGGYMEKIGFGDQPFLIYKHEDAGHPHIHIVSNTIRHDGSRINTHNIGRNQSEKARKELEQLYGLAKAERQKRNHDRTSPAKIEKALYGKHETKQAITNAVAMVFSTYHFTALPEYNAALRQFNVTADRGKEGGRIHQHQGLVYRILDSKGSTIGVPIKASSIYCKPTLRNLKVKFGVNDAAKQFYKEQVKKKVETQMANAQTLNDFVLRLSQQNVYALLRRNGDGLVYGMTYVDNISKCVFNGSDLGKAFSAAAIQARLAAKPEATVIDNDEKTARGTSGSLNELKPSGEHSSKEHLLKSKNENVLDVVLSAKELYGNVPADLLNKKRKKKKRRDKNL